MWYVEQLSRLRDVLPAPEEGYPALAAHFGAFLQSRAVADSLELGLAAALVSQQIAQGHICARLDDFAGKPVCSDRQNGSFYPALEPWVDKLLGSGVVGRPGGRCPLVLDEKSRLYLHRYWEYEQVVIRYLVAQKCHSAGVFDREIMRAALGRYFGSPVATEINWQAVAAVAALWGSFCVITGGPGTGKTTTVAKILALLLQQSGPKGLRVRLAAPTGKAAARLQESMTRAREMLALPPAIKEMLPTDVLTIHRLLGGRPHSASFKYNCNRPLSADVVVVDEASMVDLPLLAKLLLAMPPTCRLILLGDPYQLASVEPGSVFADICGPIGRTAYSRNFVDLVGDLTGMNLPDSSGCGEVLQDSLVKLQKSYRFGEGGGIARLGMAINDGDSQAAFAVLLDPQYEDVCWTELPPPQAMETHMTARLRKEKSLGAGVRDPAEAFEDFEHFMVLCALRHGPYGVDKMNRLVAGAVSGNHGAPAETLFAGKPVMIRENDYRLGLFNGDIGIILPDLKGSLAVHFRSGAQDFHTLSPHRLPSHETAYALTVHKSQGSEFESVLLVLPDAGSPLLTRELVYTAVTRARKRVEIWATRDVLEMAIARRIQRDSGIRDLLSAKSVRD